MKILFSVVLIGLSTLIILCLIIICVPGCEEKVAKTLSIEADTINTLCSAILIIITPTIYYPLLMRGTD